MQIELGLMICTSSITPCMEIYLVPFLLCKNFSIEKNIHVHSFIGLLGERSRGSSGEVSDLDP